MFIRLFAVLKMFQTFYCNFQYISSLFSISSIISKKPDPKCWVRSFWKFYIFILCCFCHHFVSWLYLLMAVLISSSEYGIMEFGRIKQSLSALERALLSVFVHTDHVERNLSSSLFVLPKFNRSLSSTTSSYLIHFSTWAPIVSIFSTIWMQHFI